MATETKPKTKANAKRPLWESPFLKSFAATGGWPGLLMCARP
jgi:hypothetical protein